MAITAMVAVVQAAAKGSWDGLDYLTVGTYSSFLGLFCLDGKPSAGMRMASRTLQGRSCCKVRLASNKIINLNSLGWIQRL